ncbi:uncharacterized protein PITG_06686 [Phytophthora infestans T30-4]|uniref:Hexosyltransferase n=1 Tax=Phytophthora infestans (strain T30-4) TaxID=403677 RepID=D0N5G0_PHYIT|nr:uncharacterized protein PITG_06686 [Phytophthora infestans T30-4]EEY70118.1 conserved hypothetical protein [Phytophthora infestans T30-4]|eukprot:XP_002998765.1 conserved hypothetical protein [Phytophthora infestans T30-4]
MPSAFAFLPPVQGDLPHHPLPTRTFQWTPVDPNTTRLRWTRFRTAPKTICALRHAVLILDSAAAITPLIEIVDSSVTTPLIETSDSHEAASRSQCLTIMLCKPLKTPQEELKLGFSCTDVAAQVQNAKPTVVTTLDDFTGTPTYHSLSIVAYKAQDTTVSIPFLRSSSAAFIIELYVRLLALPAANASLIAAADDDFKTSTVAAADIVNGDINELQTQQEVEVAHSPVLHSGLRIQRVQLHVYDSKWKAKTADTKAHRATRVAARPTPTSTSIHPVQPNKNVASKLFSYLEDATYIGYRAESKARRSQASAATPQLRALFSDSVYKKKKREGVANHVAHEIDATTGDMTANTPYNSPTNPPLLVIGVKTRVIDGFPFRQAIRRTWASKDSLPANVRVLFAACRLPGDAREDVHQTIAYKLNIYGGDLLTDVLDCED